MTDPADLADSATLTGGAQRPVRTNVLTPELAALTDPRALALAILRGNAPGYNKLRDYYLGLHRLTFASEKFRSAFGTRFQSFADNLCPAVVDSVGDRLVVEGFEVDEGPGGASDAAKIIWRRNRMDRRSGEVHQEALREGDGYVLCWPDRDGAAAIYPQRADQIAFHYDEETPGMALWAAKGWALDDGRYRLNLYFPDRIEKLVSRNSTTGLIPDSANSLVPFDVPGEPWPLPNDYGVVPVIHFSNNAPVGGFGKSELADVIPIQDALNKAVADMLVAMEYVALPQRWATGLELAYNEVTGKPEAPFTPGVERIWTSPSGDTKFGEFPGASLDGFIKVQDSFRAEVARVSGTPFHYLMLTTGDWPSGEAMKTAETRFLSRVRDRMGSMGNSWEDVMLLALRIEGAAEGLRLSTDWRDPAPRSEKEHAETVEVKTRIGVTKRQALSELGYTDDEVKVMLGEGAKEAQQAGTELMRSLMRGAPGTPPPEFGGVPGGTQPEPLVPGQPGLPGKPPTQ